MISLKTTPSRAVSGLTPRVKRLRDRALRMRVARPFFLTILEAESWKSTSGEPWWILRKGLKNRHILENVPIDFDPDELIVGRLLMRDEKCGPILGSTFRELVLSEEGASFIFGLKALELFREQVAVLFDMSRIIHLGPLSAEAGRAVITKPLEGRVLLHEDGLNLMVHLASGHPYLLYWMGRQLVEQVNRERTNLCTEKFVGRMIESLLENPPVFLLDRWEELTKREKLLLTAAVSASYAGQKARGLSLSDVAGILRSHRISLLEEELAKVSADLANRGLLSLEDGGTRIRVEDSLLSRWILAHQSVELINALQFASICCQGETIQVEHLPLEIRSPLPSARGGGLSPRDASLLGGLEGRSGRKLDTRRVAEALRLSGGNKVRAARILGVGRATLYRFLKDHPLPAEGGG